MASVSFTDLGLDCRALVDRSQAGDYLIMTGCRAWSAAEEWDVLHGDRLCPICGGRPREKHHYCACDDRAGRDHLFGVPGRPSRYPGEPVDSRINEGFSATPTTYEQPKVSKGVGRARTRRERRAG